MNPFFMSGRWDDVLATADEFTQEQVDAGGVVLGVLQSGVYVHVERGELDEARRILSLFSRLPDSTDVQDRSTYLAAACGAAGESGTRSALSGRVPRAQAGRPAS